MLAFDGLAHLGAGLVQLVLVLFVLPFVALGRITLMSFLSSRRS